jgi:hypothetical protein
MGQYDYESLFSNRDRPVLVFCGQARLHTSPKPALKMRQPGQIRGPEVGCGAQGFFRHPPGRLVHVFFSCELQTSTWQQAAGLSLV